MPVGAQHGSKLFSIVQIYFTRTREKACKGTTKNAHTQIFFRKNVFLDKNCADSAAFNDRSFKENLEATDKQWDESDEY